MLSLNNEIRNLIQELKIIQCESLKRFYTGKLQGLKLGQMLVNKFFANKSVVLWGAKILSISNDTMATNHRIKFILTNLINNNKQIMQHVNIKNIDSEMRPYMKGHTNGMEVVMAYLE